MQSTPNIRAQAITYLRSDKEFGIAFGKERNGKGYLPTQQPPSMHFPKHKQKISLTVEPSQDSVLIKNAQVHYFGKGRSKQTKSQFHSHRDPNNESITMNRVDSQTRNDAINFKHQQQIRTYREHSILQSLEEDTNTSIDHRWFKWKMNKLDLNEFQLKFANFIQKQPTKKMNQLCRRLPAISPESGHYDPQWDKIHHSSIKNIFLKRDPKSHRSGPLRVRQQIPSLRVKPEVPPQQEEDYEQMLQHLQSQIQREVNASLFTDPELKHPMKHFMMNPFDQAFLEHYKSKISDRMKETKASLARINQSVQKEESLREQFEQI